MSIPRVLHRIWFGPPMPEAYKQNAAEWRAALPDWEHLLWTEGNLPELAARAAWDAAPNPPPDAQPHVRHDRWRWRSDVARLEVLRRRGGVYVDCDTRPVRPLDALCDEHAAFVAWSPNRARSGRRLVTNALIGAVPGHPFIECLVEGLGARVASRRSEKPNVVTGPWYVDEVRRSRTWPDLAVLDESVFGEYLGHQWANRNPARAT